MQVKELAAQCGVSYRQADYWISNDYIRGEKFVGSGIPRAPLVPVEERVFRYMARLVHAGLKPSVAACAARAMAETGVRTVDLRADVRVTLLVPGDVLAERETMGC
jgi:hypothetical protein